MKTLNEGMIEKLIQRINKLGTSKIRIMEICGTHTHAIAKLGIKDLLSPYIELISGPGCPVCVSHDGYIDECINLVDNHGVIIATFGDMLRVRGSKGSLWERKSEGKRVEVIYSPEDVITLAKENKNKDIVFTAVGFETTAPLIACIVKKAKEMNITNLFFFTALKRMNPIIDLIMEHPKIKIDGVICPGHVAVITGEEPFRVITNKYAIPAVICGFEGMDIITGIYILVEQISGNKPLEFINNYSDCVSQQGNEVALQTMKEVFQISDTIWRGIGLVRNSALVLRDEYGPWDAAQRWHIQEEETYIDSHCECRDILLGIKKPEECVRFGRGCTPEHPLGPCMVSGEGVCAAHYHYRRFKS